jgi:hypothetical protein
MPAIAGRENRIPIVVFDLRQPGKVPWAGGERYDHQNEE